MIMNTINKEQEYLLSLEISVLKKSFHVMTNVDKETQLLKQTFDCSVFIVKTTNNYFL